MREWSLENRTWEEENKKEEYADRKRRRQDILQEVRAYIL